MALPTREAFLKSGLVPVNCSICQESLTNPASTPCDHIFCRHCAVEWLKSSNTCPLCRRVLFVPAQAPNMLEQVNFPVPHLWRRPRSPLNGGAAPFAPMQDSEPLRERRAPEASSSRPNVVPAIRDPEYVQLAELYHSLTGSNIYWDGYSFGADLTNSPLARSPNIIHAMHPHAVPPALLLRVLRQEQLSDDQWQTLAERRWNRIGARDENFAPHPRVWQEQRYGICYWPRHLLERDAWWAEVRMRRRWINMLDALHDVIRQDLRSRR